MLSRAELKNIVRSLACYEKKLYQRDWLKETAMSVPRGTGFMKINLHQSILLMLQILLEVEISSV